MRRLVMPLCCGLLLGSWGCRPSTDAPPPAPSSRDSEPLQVVVLDDPGLAEAVRDEWTARGEGAVNVQSLDSPQWLQAPTAADLFIFPASLTGELMRNRRLDWLSSEDLGGKYMLDDVHYQVRAGTMSWEDRVLAAPFGAPHPVLVYRSDVLAAVDAAPPRTWSELAALKQTLESNRTAWDPEAAMQALVEPLGLPDRPAGFAHQALLVRSAAYAVDQNQDSPLWALDSLATRIDSPPFVQALRELAACWAESDPDVLAVSPADALRRVYLGQAAMALTWPSLAIGQEVPDAPHLDLIRFAPPPGADRQFDWRNQQWKDLPGEPVRVPVIGLQGRVAAAARSAANKKAALSMISWLTGPQASAQVAPGSRDSAPFRNTHREVASRWVGPALPREAATQYYEILQRLQARGPALPYPRIAAWPRLRDALDQAVAQTLRDQADPQQTLTAAAEVWNAYVGGLTTEERQAIRQQLRASLP